MSGEDSLNIDSIAPSVIVTVVVLAIGLSTISTALRMYTRYFVQRRLWWDDWIMVSAWSATIALCIIQSLMIRYGGGLSIDEVSADEQKQFNRLFTDAQEIARVAILLAKVSILLLYIRLFFPRGANRSTLWWVIWATIVVNVLYTVTFVLVTLTECAGRGLRTGETCSNHWSVLIISSAVNVASDLIVLVIPIVSVWALRLSKKRKWTLAAAFSFGALAPIISIGRLWYQAYVGYDLTEVTVAYTLYTLVTIGEQTIAMIIGSAPVCSALVRKAMQKKRSLAPNPNPTVSHRIWPARVGRSDPDSFRITTDLVGTTSTEVLFLE